MAGIVIGLLLFILLAVVVGVAVAWLIYVYTNKSKRKNMQRVQRDIMAM